MKISVVIPTHNRAESLRNAMDSVLALKDEADFEFVIVDNNSTDSTKQVVESYAPRARYVFEGNTSFTMARKAGADNSTGDLMLYLDDDVLVAPGSLRAIVEVFSTRADCGVIAGRIDPEYAAPPPQWALDCQKTFNAWSLFNPDNVPGLHAGLQEVMTAAGPMMAIRRSAYERAGGFPPDTIGVETNRGERSFNKLYIGPGDYGLCIRAREQGFRILYSDDIRVRHVIPPVRFTLGFWRSRAIGEGYHLAISQRGFFGLSRWRTFVARLRWQLVFCRSELAFLERLASSRASLPHDGMLPEELLVFYAKAYLDMDRVLRRHPGLWEFLWDIGAHGVSDGDFERVMRRLPVEYKALVANELVYDATPIDSPETYRRLVLERGQQRDALALPLRSATARRLAAHATQTARSLRGRLLPQTGPAAP